MGFFKKTVSDEEWLVQVKPLYDESIPIVAALNELVAKEPLPDDGDKTLKDAYHKLSFIGESMKGFPNPTSQEARQAKKNLESAIKSYTKGTNNGLAFYRDMAGRLGETYRSRVGLNKLAEGTLGGILLNFLESIKIAQKIMEKANTYFSTL